MTLDQDHCRAAELCSRLHMYCLLFSFVLKSLTTLISCIIIDLFMMTMTWCSVAPMEPYLSYLCWQYAANGKLLRICSATSAVSVIRKGIRTYSGHYSYPGCIRSLFSIKFFCQMSCPNQFFKNCCPHSTLSYLFSICQFETNKTPNSTTPSLACSQVNQIDYILVSHGMSPWLRHPPPPWKPLISFHEPFSFLLYHLTVCLVWQTAHHLGLLYSSE